MATRGLYKFYDNVETFNNKQPTAVIYRHWDNYLESGGMDLLDFLVWLRDSNFDNRFTDSSYLSSKFVVYLAREFATSWIDEPLDFISVGIMPNNTDCWEEYTYHIVSEVDNSGLPKVYVDSYEYDEEYLLTALANENLIQVNQ
jgi:hypothetical protein